MLRPLALLSVSYVRRSPRSYFPSRRCDFPLVPLPVVGLMPAVQWLGHFDRMSPDEIEFLLLALVAMPDGLELLTAGTESAWCAMVPVSEGLVQHISAVERVDWRRRRDTAEAHSWKRCKKALQALPVQVHHLCELLFQKRVHTNCNRLCAAFACKATVDSLAGVDSIAMSCGVDQAKFQVRL